MGDRGNIGFVQHTWDAETHQSKATGAVFLYTHWAGYRVQEMAAEAIAKAEPRWGDVTYATRIALTHLIGDAKGDTGWGVGCLPGENSYPLPMVDFDKREVRILTARQGDAYDLRKIMAAYAKAEPIPFAEFHPTDA